MRIKFVLSFCVFDKKWKEIGEVCNMGKEEGIEKVIKMMKEEKMWDRDFEFVKVYDFYFWDNVEMNF